ncbi:glycosyltransferase [Rhypophila decipiens]
MGIIPSPARAHRAHPILFPTFLLLGAVFLWCSRSVLYDAYTLAALPLVWSHQSSSYLISAEHDGFDITFANYSKTQVSAAPFEDRVPPILHHVSLGSGAQSHSKWMEVRQTCLDIHPGWEAMLWTDDKANAFVAEQFPELESMWQSYRYPIQKIDSLRYMILYVYGGAILDMDLQCNRALGPLRRFEFVAPAANPVGFSVGFMMASKRNEFVGEIVRNLERYNRHWLLLPYPTVMFSTGCHYASLQPNRHELKVLAGTKSDPNMHRLNGQVKTPIFDHLGSSSWHSYDAALILSLGKSGAQWKIPVLLVGGSLVTFVIMRRIRRRRLSLRGK